MAVCYARGAGSFALWMLDVGPKQKGGAWHWSSAAQANNPPRPIVAQKEIASCCFGPLKSERLRTSREQLIGGFQGNERQAWLAAYISFIDVGET